MKHWLFLFFLLFSGFLKLAAQTVTERADTVHTHSVHTLLQAFQHGHFHGHFRQFTMATDNTRQLTDYYAVAAGGGLHFSSAPYYGFSVGVGGMFNFNLASSDLGAKDPSTGAKNRYEIGLFDIENAANRNDLDRMESFWLRYERRNLDITVGKQNVQTPFINHQDSRMRPTAVSGIWLNSRLNERVRLEGGWIWGISPRSTVNWYSVESSIGLYPSGLNPNGSASGYPEHLKSKGLALAGLHLKIGKNWKGQVWDQWVENIFNTAYTRLDGNYPLGNGHHLLLGLQLVRQDAMNNGGNDEPSKSYFVKNGHSHVISTQAGWERGRWQALAAYTRTTAEGRFLTPREWGREPFYTFMSRERIEGSGDVHAATLRCNWQDEHEKWQISLAYGQFYLPDVKNVEMNKYTFPAYRQLNAEARYTFGRALQGLKAHFLYVWKGRMGDIYGNDRYVINRVNMSQYNLILNYTW